MHEAIRTLTLYVACEFAGKVVNHGGDNMEQVLTEIINSPGLWIASAFLVLVSVSQSILFFRASLKEAKAIGIEKSRITAGIRSATITALGPSLSPVIVLVSMIAVIGAPTTWMRLCDVGAARTELAVASIAATAAGTELGAESFGMQAFTYVLWAMALNNLGWLLVVFVLNHRMSGVVSKMYATMDAKWVKLLMGGATLGLFAYLINNQLINKAPIKWVTALIAAALMIILTTVFKKHQRIQELALGIAMLGGMFITQAIMG